MPTLSEKKEGILMDKTEADEIVNFVAPGDIAGQPRNQPVSVQVTDTALIIATRDGRIIHTPLAWFPFLVSASAAQRQDFRIMGSSILWRELEDGISMETILFGDPSQ